MTAYISNRRRKDGGNSIQVKWNDTEFHRGQSETFTDPASATEFKCAVTAFRDTWPKGWNRGRDWAWNGPSVTTFDEVFAHWSARMQQRARSGLIKPYTAQRYLPDYTRHEADFLGDRDFTTLTIEDAEGWILEHLHACPPTAPWPMPANLAIRSDAEGSIARP